MFDLLIDGETMAMKIKMREEREAASLVRSVRRVRTAAGSFFGKRRAQTRKDLR